MTLFKRANMFAKKTRGRYQVLLFSHRWGSHRGITDTGKIINDATRARARNVHLFSWIGTALSLNFWTDWFRKMLEG
jgi:hypothetical protein